MLLMNEEKNRKRIKKEKRTVGWMVVVRSKEEKGQSFPILLFSLLNSLFNSIRFNSHASNEQKEKKHTIDQTKER